MGRKPCCEKVGLRRGPWTADEDAKLVSYITANGICCWRAIPKLAGLLRCGKSCRLRWTNYLRPDLKRGIFTEEEENLILDLHATLGNRWSRIAAQLPGRTDNEIKNYWNTRLKKRLRSQGLDPATHLPLEDGEGESSEDGDSAETRSGKKGVKPPVRQPRGPKPQLNLWKDGPVLLKVPKSTAAAKPSPSVPVPKCEADSSGDLSPSLSACSTVTVGSHEPAPPTRKLSSVPSYPEAELWKCIKPSATTASSALSTAALLDEWDSYSLFLNPYPMAPKPQEIQTVDMLPSFTSQQDFGAASCFAQSEMSWSMDVEMAQPAPESLFALPPTRELMAPPHHPSQDLQKLAALLDLI